MSNLKLVSSNKDDDVDIIYNLQSMLDKYGRIETIERIMSIMQEPVFEAFNEEQAASIMALVQTSLELCASKWCIDKED